MQGGNNAVIDAVLARSRRYEAPARGITLKVSCQRNATKPSADDSTPEKDKPVRRRKMEGRRKERTFEETTTEVKENCRMEVKEKEEWWTLFFHTRRIESCDSRLEAGLLGVHSECNPSRY